MRTFASGDGYMLAYHLYIGTAMHIYMEGQADGCCSHLLNLGISLSEWWPCAVSGTERGQVMDLGGLSS